MNFYCSENPENAKLINKQKSWSIVWTELPIIPHQWKSDFSTLCLIAIVYIHSGVTAGGGGRGKGQGGTVPPVRVVFLAHACALNSWMQSTELWLGGNVYKLFTCCLYKVPTNYDYRKSFTRIWRCLSLFAKMPCVSTVKRWCAKGSIFYCPLHVSDVYPKKCFALQSDQKLMTFWGSCPSPEKCLLPLLLLKLLMFPPSVAS